MANKAAVYFVVVGDATEGPVAEKDLHDSIECYVGDGTPLGNIKIYKADSRPGTVAFRINA